MQQVLSTIQTRQMLLKIMVISDQNELKYHSSTKTNITYEYTKSKTKLGELIEWPWEQLDKLIANNIIKEI